MFRRPRLPRFRLRLIVLFAAVITVVLALQFAGDDEGQVNIVREAWDYVTSTVGDMLDQFNPIDEGATGSQPDQTRSPATAPGYPGGAALVASDVERWVVQLTNDAREERGLLPLDADPEIGPIARAHSENMSRLNVFSHESRLNVFSHEIDGKGPIDRATDAGYTCRVYRPDGSYAYGLSENIYKYPRVTEWSSSTRWGGTRYGPTVYAADARAMALNLVEGGMDSPDHRENILDPNNRWIGVGVAITTTEEYGFMQETVFATQNFSECEW